MSATSQKPYYTIGEVARQLNVTTSLVRFWEKKFPALKPQKNAQGIRRYTTANVAMLQRIYYLVKEQGYTLAGAQAALRQSSNKEDTGQERIIQQLKAVRASLVALKDVLP